MVSSILLNYSLYFCVKRKLIWAVVQKSTLGMYIMLNINSFTDLGDMIHYLIIIYVFISVFKLPMGSSPQGNHRLKGATMEGRSPQIFFVLFYNFTYCPTLFFTFIIVNGKELLLGTYQCVIKTQLFFLRNINIDLIYTVFYDSELLLSGTLKTLWENFFLFF